MSKPGFISRREAVIKKIKAQARKEQHTFHSCPTPRDVPDWQLLGGYIYPQARHAGGKPARGKLPLGKESDAFFTQKRNTGFSKGVWSTSEGAEESHEAEFFESLAAPPSRSEVPMVFSLDEVPIRVAKPKGIRKEYEFVLDPMQRVLALDDETASAMSEEDWESIFAEVEAAAEMEAYSSVVKGGRG